MDHKPDLNISISKSNTVYQGEDEKKVLFLVVGVMSVFANVVRLAALIQAACLCSCLCIIYECTLLGSVKMIFQYASARKRKHVCFLFVFVQQKLWLNVILMRK